MKQARKNEPTPFKVFISYSRSDTAFTGRQATALEPHGIDVLIDRHHLPPLEEWKKELLRLAEAIDTVIFIISTRSVVSEWCEWELAQVAKLNKRPASVVFEEVRVIPIPESIRRINHLWFAADCHFGAAFDCLVRARKVDHECRSQKDRCHVG